MDTPDRPGLFVTFEGLDGSGFDHHASALARLLGREGYRVVLTGEPTKSLIGGLIRARLAREWEIAPETLQLLFTADRAEHLRTKILPALEAGRIVICSRYILSALAYNVVLVNDPAWLAALNSRFIQPDLTFLLAVSPALCARRLKQSKLELELYKEEQKLKLVWQAYQQLSTRQSSIITLDGERDDVAIIDDLLVSLKRLLAARSETGLDKTAAGRYSGRTTSSTQRP
ncbi:dTMP kinase [Candidatus Berkelbacteria bacterium]|nr:dTMP kinase [Candidatus Berkelbacteria bacterium]